MVTGTKLLWAGAGGQPQIPDGFGDEEKKDGLSFQGGAATDLE